MAPAIPNPASPTLTPTTASPSAEGRLLPERSLIDCLHDLRSAIFRRRPILGEIKLKHGWKTLHRYSQDFLDVNPSPHLDARKQELIAVAEELLTERLGAKVAGEVAAQLERCALVSTTDHHCIIHHPFWVNANIISAIPYTGKTEEELKYLVVFSFAGVSLNNASGYPRGIAFHGGINGSGNVVRLPILPDKHKMSTVYATRAFTREDLDRAQRALQKKIQSGEVVEQRGSGVASLIEEYLGAGDVLQGKDLCSQITTVNYRLWPKLFHASKTTQKEAAATTRNIPDLIYLEIETLVRELLLRHHLKNADSMIGKLLFNTQWRELALEHFDGIHGAFHRDSASGTYFFWGVDPAGHRVRLHIEGEELVSCDGAIRVALTPESIAEALITRKIFPSMLLSYLMVSLYYGFKCLGGFCQVHDLTMTKKAWQTILRRINEHAEADAVEPVQTKELGGDGMVLSYFETKQGNLIPATGIDMSLDDIDTSFGSFVDMSRKLALEEAMQPMLPEMYTVLYTNDERDPMLASIKPERIMEVTGLQEKLHREIVRREIASSGLERLTA